MLSTEVGTLLNKSHRQLIGICIADSHHFKEAKHNDSPTGSCYRNLKINHETNPYMRTNIQKQPENLDVQIQGRRTLNFIETDYIGVLTLYRILLVSFAEV